MKKEKVKKLPKLYSPKKIRFSSLRMGLGEGYGVIFDVDTMIDRHARRVIVEGGGWKWQIKNIYDEAEWDNFVITDQEILNEIGMDVQCVEIL